jgi:Transposase IS66 family
MHVGYRPFSPSRNISSTATLPVLCAAAHNTGYKALFAQGVIEPGCMAHARRKFFDLHTTNKSEIAQTALEYIAQLYDVERAVSEGPARAIARTSLCSLRRPLAPSVAARYVERTTPTSSR